MTHTPKNDGGPAFPKTIHNGMSLRDYFAAQAMTGLLYTDAAALGGKICAESAYEIADAMLAARQA